MEEYNDDMDLSQYGFSFGEDEQDEPIAEPEEEWSTPVDDTPSWEYDPTDDDGFIAQFAAIPARTRGNYTHGYQRTSDAEPSYATNTTARSAGSAASISPQEAFRYYTQEKGLAPHVAAGIIGNLQQESGLNTGAVGDNGTSFGLAQWHNERWNGVQRAAKQQGRNAYDPYFQLDHVLSEPGESARALSRVNQTRTPQDAALAFGRAYERYNPKAANESARAQYASQLAGNYQLGGIVTDIAGRIVNKTLDKLLNPDAGSIPAVNGFLQQQQVMGMQQDQELLRQKQLMQAELTNPDTYQQGGSSFDVLRAYKPQLAGGVALSSANVTQYKTDQLGKFGFNYNPDNTLRDGINFSMKNLGNNVTGKAYSNDPVLNPVSTPKPASTPSLPGIKAPTDWLDAIMNPGIGVGIQVAGALALNADSEKKRAMEWDKLKDLPYQRVRAGSPVTGTAQPLYAQYGF